MKRSLREVLAAHHIAAVAIVMLLLWSLDSWFRAIMGPLSRTASFLITAVAILRVPYFSTTLNGADRLLLLATFANLLGALNNLGAAWLLARWVYGEGPLRSLTRYRPRFTRRTCV